MYETIRRRKSVRDAYLENVLKLGEITREEADRIAVKRKAALEDDLGRARAPDGSQSIDLSYGLGVWRPYQGGPDAKVPEVPTHVEKGKIVELLKSQSMVPEDFHPHPKIERLIKTRAAMANGEHPLDWAAGEALAFATL